MHREPDVQRWYSRSCDYTVIRTETAGKFSSTCTILNQGPQMALSRKMISDFASANQRWVEMHLRGCLGSISTPSEALAGDENVPGILQL